MSKITITYYGHACFQISYEGHSVLFDPYEDQSVPGLTLPKDISVDAVYCSHEHADHNASELISVNGNDPFPVSFLSVPHDHDNGTKRGMSNITWIRCGKIRIAHLGDIGRLPTNEEYEMLNQADILLIPAGGYFTIDAEEAKEIVEHCDHKLTVLMHYRDGKTGYDVLEDIAAIAKVFTSLERICEPSITFDENEIPAKTITLLPKQ